MKKIHPKPPTTHFIGFRCSTPVLMELKRQAANDGRSVSAFLRRLLEQSLKDTLLKTDGAS